MTDEKDQERDGFQPIPLTTRFLLRCLMEAVAYGLARAALIGIAIIAAVLCSDFLNH